MGQRSSHPDEFYTENLETCNEIDPLKKYV